MVLHCNSKMCNVNKESRNEEGILWVDINIVPFYLTSCGVCCAGTLLWSGNGGAWCEDKIYGSPYSSPILFRRRNICTCKLGSCIIHDDDKFWFCKLLKTCEEKVHAQMHIALREKVIILLLGKTVTFGFVTTYLVM